ncbi:diguanylate cyclase/phosphodiesterase with PAS/PAC and GAF sensor(s) [Rhodopseudomonas palustris TIE-1]|uniref:EAL domain-containing protein n=1 Tax=Rhodopseudomonas palustris TaxID=1076 RepID=UPI000164A9F8|nr:EAL domain-containing protein [Rhodopseudomonas palustris]ACF02080.1 diguanylate cyclase/phosphodiesterase with PAS/PAC and GAF sensor(s) [Rhodopseudomonas palustris TIE-1]
MRRHTSSLDDQSLWRIALDYARDAAVIIDDGGHICYVNQAAERIWGIGRADLVGSHSDCLGVNAIQPEPVAGSHLTNAASDLPLAIDITSRDNRSITAELTRSTIRADSLNYTLLTVRDVTPELERRKGIELLTSIADRTTRAVLVTDPELKLLYTNAAFTSLFGYSAEDAKGQNIIDLLSGRHTNRRTIAGLKRWIADAEGGEEEILVYDQNGDEIWISADVKALRNAQGRITQVFALLTDISETRQLRMLQQVTLGALADEIPITDVADRMCRFVEKIAPDVVSTILHVDAQGLLHPLGGPNLPDDYSRALDGVSIGPMVGSCGAAAYFGRPVLALDIETDPRWQPFKKRPLEIGLRACWSSPIKAKDGRVIGTFAFYFRACRPPSRWHHRIVDACLYLGALAIERMESRAQIARLAYFDMLTGLPNRARLRDLIADATAACPHGRTVALAFLDVDNFKDINDTLGHAAGDEFLVEFARRLRDQVQPGDVVGRLGGDEFVVVLPNREPAEIEPVVARINEALMLPFALCNSQVPMSASIGVSLYPDNATDIDSLINQADTAMYRAKRSGRSTYRLFNCDMHGAAEQRMAYAAALRSALANNRLGLHYQPQIRTSDGALHGVEAMARWHDPVLGPVPPTKFIPLAEECGLIDQIACWSIREACRQMRVWRDQGLEVPSVSVNLSPINFENAALPTLVADTLATYHLPPEALMLEVTEGVAQDNRSAAHDTMAALRRIGVGLSLDDFGTGYSNLNRLAQLPIRELKIDRGFMSELETSPTARAVVTTVVRVGQSLALSVVAEGVETTAQFQLLSDLGCDVAQGFLYAPALAPAAFEHWLLGYSASRAGTMMERIEPTTADHRPAPRTATRRRH